MLENMDKHLFLSDREIFEASNLQSMTQALRRESIHPVLAPDFQTGDSSIGYGSAVWDEIENCYKLWYCSHGSDGISLAVSEDGLNWNKKGKITATEFDWGVDNVQVLKPAPVLHPWFSGIRFAGTLYCRKTKSIHVMRSLDGVSWEIKPEPVLPSIGDRSSLYYDPVREIYMFTSRPPYYETVNYSKYRKIALWESRDMLEYDYKGIILRADEEDENDVQLYGMQPFRCGNMLLGLLEIYHENIERLDTQLAYSPDGLHWKRVSGRHSTLNYGGEGSWDSHWVVPTLNAPLCKDDRLMFLYSGASTKHGSKNKHRRCVGLASLRRDGWLSLEAGRKEGQLVTDLLPLHKEMRLTVNVSCPSGYFAAEVLTCDCKVLQGYEASMSKCKDIDTCDLRVQWGGNEIIKVDGLQYCRLRFYLYQGSLFSYTWSENAN